MRADGAALRGVGRRGAWLTHEAGGPLHDERLQEEGLRLSERAGVRRVEWGDATSTERTREANSAVELDCALRDELFVGGLVVRQERWRGKARAQPDHPRVTLAGNGPAIWLEGYRDRKGRLARAELRAAGWDETIRWEASDGDPRAEETRAGLMRAAEIAIADGSGRARAAERDRMSVRRKTVALVRNAIRAHHAEHPGERLTLRNAGSGGLEEAHETRWDGRAEAVIVWLADGGQTRIPIEEAE